MVYKTLMDQEWIRVDQDGSGAADGSGWIWIRIWIRMDQDGSGLDEIKTLIYP